MYSNRKGQRVPDVMFRTRNDHEWVDVSSRDLFAGKTVVLFSLPGAFTPTCSSSHVPRYNQLADDFHRQGVDEIICLSVNDAFVMNQWQEDQQAYNLRFVPDGNGEFTVAGATHDVGLGRALLMPANVPHAVRAVGRFKMLLTMLRR